MSAATARSSVAICVSRFVLHGAAFRANFLAGMVDVLAYAALLPVEMGLSRREIQPGTLLSLLRLADMCPRVVIVASRNHALMLTLRERVVCFLDVEAVWPRRARELGKDKSGHAPEVGFPQEHGHSGNHFAATMVSSPL